MRRFFILAICMFLLTGCSRPKQPEAIPVPTIPALESIRLREETREMFPASFADDLQIYLLNNLTAYRTLEKNLQTDDGILICDATSTKIYRILIWDMQDRSAFEESFQAYVADEQKFVSAISGLLACMMNMAEYSGEYRYAKKRGMDHIIIGDDEIYFDELNDLMKDFYERIKENVNIALSCCTIS